VNLEIERGEKEWRKKKQGKTTCGTPWKTTKRS
jgi:hypothetical protein